jgi:transposase
LVRERRGAELDAWIAEAQASGVEALTRLAAGLRSEHAAVQAGLTEKWSNGVSEGQVKRLKLLKRQSYGRAGVELLRQQMLHAS